MKVKTFQSYEEAIQLLVDFLDMEPKQGSHRFKGWWIQNYIQGDRKSRPAIRFSFEGGLEWIKIVYALTYLGCSPTVNQSGKTTDIEIGTQDEAYFLARLLRQKVNRKVSRQLLDLMWFIRDLRGLSNG